MSAGEGEGIHGGIGIANEAQYFFHSRIAVLIDTLAEEKDGVAVVCGLLP